MSIEIYDTRDVSFDNTIDYTLPSESPLRIAVLKAVEAHEERYINAFDENEGLEAVTEFVDMYGDASEEEFIKYFRARFGMSRSEYRKGRESKYRPDQATERCSKRPAVTAVAHTDDHIMIKEKKRVRYTIDRVEGYKREEVIERVPVSKTELSLKIAELTVFPQRRNVYVRDRRFPIFPIISVFLCAVVFILPIFLSILNNDIDVQNKEKDAYIRQLNEEIVGLQEELNRKNDMVAIEQLAREKYGMIEIEISNTHLMSASSEQIVLKDSEAEEEDIFVALLNALGIFIEK